MSQIVEKVREVIAEPLTNAGYEIVDVEYGKAFNRPTLTVYIYKEGGIMLDDCEVVSRLIDPLLDAADPTEGNPYDLNVSSPGLDRPFKTQRDFERNYGTEVEIKLYAPIKGKKLFEGVLIEKNENTVVIENDGKRSSLECGKIAYVRPLVRFN